MQKVSIIMPVYNAANFLQKSVTSLLQQTYSNKEIIIVDDSSSDNSYAIAQSFESENVTVLQQPNAGAAVARNTGLTHASGDYIQFMDVDDFLSPDKIEKQVEALKGNKNKIAVCNYTTFTDDAHLNGNILTTDQSRFIYSTDNPAQFLINLLGGNGAPDFIQTNSWLTPRQIIDKAGYWRNYRCPDDDGEYFVRVLLASEGVMYVPGVVNFYRKPLIGITLSNTIKRKYIQNTLLSIDLKYSNLYQYKELEGFNKAFATQYFEFAVYNYPANTLLSKIAQKRFNTFSVKVPTPMLGGKILGVIGKFFGWKIARLIRYVLKEKNKIKNR